MNEFGYDIFMIGFHRIKLKYVMNDDVNYFIDGSHFKIIISGNLLLECPLALWKLQSKVFFK